MPLKTGSPFHPRGEALPCAPRKRPRARVQLQVNLTSTPNMGELSHHRDTARITRQIPNRVSHSEIPNAPNPRPDSRKPTGTKEPASHRHLHPEQLPTRIFQKFSASGLTIRPGGFSTARDRQEVGNSAVRRTWGAAPLPRSALPWCQAWARAGPAADRTARGLPITGLRATMPAMPTAYSKRADP
jgi:hypothetical protein